MNIIEDKLNKYDQNNKINLDIRINNVEEEISGESTIDNERPWRENTGTGVNRLNISFNENSYGQSVHKQLLMKEDHQ